VVQKEGDGAESSVHEFLLVLRKSDCNSVEARYNIPFTTKWAGSPIFWSVCFELVATHEFENRERREKICAFGRPLTAILTQIDND
jgi:hypothetical protein